ncbi:MAG: hypothetical protein AAF799_12620 [Myxococcota bacterium]
MTSTSPADRSPVSPERIVLRCESCGGTLPTPDVASVLCPGCGVVNRIDGALLETIRAHQKRVGHYRKQVDSATEQAIGARLSHVLGKGWAIGIVTSWLVAGVVMIPDTLATHLLALAIFVGPFIGLFVHVRRAERRMRAEIVAARQREAMVYVACPTCGGQSEFLPDEPVRPCGYCGGTLAADAQSRADMIAAARDEAVREQWMATHQRWRSSAITHRDPATDLVPYFVIGGLGSLLVLGTVITDIRLLLFDPGQPVDTGGLVVLHVLSLGVLVGVGAPLWARRSRARRWTAAVDSLARATRGRVEWTLGAFAEWLVAHWRGEFTSREICAGRQYAVVRSTRAPLWALSLAPVALEDSLVVRHVRLVVPGDARGLALTRFAEAMRELGMKVRLEDAGLIAQWVGRPADGLYDDPEGLRPLAEAIAAASEPASR